MVFVVAMSSFGITYGVRAFNAVPGEVSFLFLAPDYLCPSLTRSTRQLRLMPSRYYPQAQQQKKEVWEQD